MIETDQPMVANRNRCSFYAVAASNDDATINASISSCSCIVIRATQLSRCNAVSSLGLAGVVFVLQRNRVSKVKN